MKPLPHVIRTLTLILASATALQACGMLVFACVAGARPIWLLFGFEAVVLVCAVLGVLFARGKYQEGQGLGAISIGGSIAVCSFLAWLTVSKITLSMPGAELVVKSYLLTRLAVGAWFAMVASVAVLTRSASSVPFVRGALISGCALAAIGVGMFVFRAGLPASIPGGVRSAGTALLVVVVGILICIFGHCVIRAFEQGRTDADGAPPRV